MKVNTGNDIQARQMGGGQVGTTGTAGSGGSAPTATTLTDSGSPAWTTNQWAGYRVVAGSVWGVVQSNTASVLTVDRWYAPATPGGAAGTTPAGGVGYTILDGSPPAWFMGLTANSSAAVATDTQLPGEIVTGGGGLVRKICTWAHTTGVNSWTLTAVYTANGSDSLPVTIAKIGVFNSMVVSSVIGMLFETLYTTTATLSASGDQLTSVDTVTS
jgi:hypothetical protein